MAKPGQGELFGAESPADLIRGLEHDHAQPRLCELDGCDQAVGTGSDDYRVDVCLGSGHRETVSPSTLGFRGRVSATGPRRQSP